MLRLRATSDLECVWSPRDWCTSNLVNLSLLFRLISAFQGCKRIVMIILGQKMASFLSVRLKMYLAHSSPDWLALSLSCIHMLLERVRIKYGRALLWQPQTEMVKSHQNAGSGQHSFQPGMSGVWKRDASNEHRVLKFIVRMKFLKFHPRL